MKSPRDSHGTSARATNDAVVWALLALAACAVHGRCLWFGFTDLDDVNLIVGDQAFLSRPGGLWRVFTRSYLHVVDSAHAYYRPLVTASYALDARWSGVRPLGYHLTNVLLHAAAGVLFFMLLRRYDIGRRISAAAALLFAVHPVLVPAVAWIPGRNDSLLAVFVLGAWLFFLQDRARCSLRTLAAHLALFALALLTKETAASLPFVCASHVALEPRTAARDTWRGMGRMSAGWFSILAMRAALQPSAPPATVRDVLSNLQILPEGLGMLALPWNLSAFADTRDRPLWPGLIAVAVLAAASVLVSGVRRRVVATGAAAFVLLSAPALFVPGVLTLDHRLYLPTCGALLACAEILRALMLEPRVLGAFASAGLTALSALTIAYEGVFRDGLAFARNAVAASPHSSLAHFCLGQAYQLANDDARALGEYRTALALGPAQIVHNNIAVIDMASGRWGEAENELRLELATNPRYGKALYNLGIVLRREGRFDEACDAEQQALRWEPENPRARRERDMACVRP